MTQCSPQQSWLGPSLLCTWLLFKKLSIFLPDQSHDGLWSFTQSSRSIGFSSRRGHAREIKWLIQTVTAGFRLNGSKIIPFLSFLAFLLLTFNIKSLCYFLSCIYQHVGFFGFYNLVALHGRWSWTLACKSWAWCEAGSNKISFISVTTHRTD